MDAVRVHKVVEKDGELTLSDLPFQKGQRVEVILLGEQSSQEYYPTNTFGDILDSGLAGLWKDRDDIGDSVEFARQLREQVQTRETGGES